MLYTHSKRGYVSFGDRNAHNPTNYRTIRKAHFRTAGEAESFNERICRRFTTSLYGTELRIVCNADEWSALRQEWRGEGR